MRLTRAVRHSHRGTANQAKIAALDALAALAALDALAEEELRLCQPYTPQFCTEAQADTYAAPCFDSPLAQRWQRVAIQHAAGSAQSWRAKYAAASRDYLDLLAEQQEAPEGKAPEWQEWNTPVLNEPVMPANANVALLQPAQDSSCDSGLRVSTLEQGHPVFLPVQRATSHRQALAGKTLDSRTTLARKPDGWWLPLS
jgi:hypothetical protein